MAVVLFMGSSLNLNALSLLVSDECVEYAWAQADAAQANYQKLSGLSYSSWEMWDMTNAIYESCINQ